MVFMSLLIESFSPKLLLTHGILNLYFRNLNKWLCPIYRTFEIISTTCKNVVMARVSCKIYVLFYKNGTIVKSDATYEPLMAGNSLLAGNKSIKGDDSGDNISSRNRFYSELTGIYWIWKNTSHDVVGTCHYRRFFTAKPEPTVYKLKRLFYYPLGIYKKRTGLIYTNNIRFWQKRILTEDEVSALMNRYDAVLPQARQLKYPVRTHYKRYHSESDLAILESIISENYPDYLSSFNQVLNGKKLFANNMFVLKDTDFQELMGWLFDILFEFEKRTTLENYEGYQKRVLGFISERLITVWFKKKNLNYIELPVIYFKNLKKE